MKKRSEIINLNEVKKAVKDRLLSAVEDNQFKKDVADQVVKDIQYHARIGKGIKDGKATPFKPLQPSSIKHREYLRDAGNATARPYKDQFSNLSISGQLIDSVEAKLQKDSIIVEATGNRVPYLTKGGVNSKAEPIGNKELSKIHHQGDPSNNLPARPFIGLRKEMKDRIFTTLKEYLRRSLGKKFKVRP